MASAAAAKEVGAIRQWGIGIVACQPQPGFVDKGGRLQRVAGGFVGHAAAAKFPQLVVRPAGEVRSGAVTATS